MIRLDFNSACRPATATGLDLQHVVQMQDRVASALENVQKGGPYTGFMQLPDGDDLAQEALRWASELDPRITQVIVMGIGGSSLGPLALYESVHINRLLCGLAPEPPARRLVFLDNSDPDTVGEVLESLDPRQTLYMVITKSGSTAETASQMMIAWQIATQALGESTREHFVFVTDPKDGDLRTLAGRLGVKTFPIPPNVGGRFSVLSAVGLVPGAAAGVDPVSLLQGAKTAQEACTRTRLQDNPAAMLASTAFLLDTKQGRDVHVIMPYSDRLARVGAWFRQLWAESLGKRTSSGARVGPTPLDARGATDQHSLLQLLVEGPPDKFVIFIDVQDRRTCSVPHLFEDLGSFGYLGGHSVGELIAAERRGTEASLSAAGTPSVTLTVQEVSPWSMGALLQVLMVSTAIAGSLYEIDAFNQPGVEEGKKLTSGLLGRPGFEGKRQEAEAFTSAKKQDLVMEI